MDEVVKRNTWNGLSPRKIRCPECNARHFPNRNDTKRYVEEGSYAVVCGCGCEYQVVKKDKYGIIRRVK